MGRTKGRAGLNLSQAGLMPVGEDGESEGREETEEPGKP
ncbi:unnamed protein product, partial [Allacma fusca]